MEERLVCLIGNIGVGKTTILERLRNELPTSQFCCFDEPVKDWKESGILQDFYEKVNLPLEENQGLPVLFQMMAFSSRLSKLAAHISSKRRSQTWIADGHILVDRHVFATQLNKSKKISDAQMKWYNDFFDNWQIIAPYATPAKFIYLRASPETCLKRIQTRARTQEVGISVEYLEKLHSAFESFSVTFGPTLVVDAEEDREMEEVYREIYESIVTHGK